MNRRTLEKHLRAHGCILHHHGAKHDIWVNPANLAQPVWETPVSGVRMCGGGRAPSADPATRDLEATGLMHDIDLILTLTGGLAAALVGGYVTYRLGLSPLVG